MQIFWQPSLRGDRLTTHAGLDSPHPSYGEWKKKYTITFQRVYGFRLLHLRSRFGQRKEKKTDPLLSETNLFLGTRRKKCISSLLLFSDL